jgi:hypothetical protein
VPDPLKTFVQILEQGTAQDREAVLASLALYVAERVEQGRLAPNDSVAEVVGSLTVVLERSSMATCGCSLRWDSQAR